MIMNTPEEGKSLLQQPEITMPDIYNGDNLFRKIINGTSAYADDVINNETDLRLSYERLNEMSAQSNTYIWEINLDGLYTYVSPVVEKVTGFRPEELINKKYFYDLLTPDTRDKFMKEAFKIIAKRKSLTHRDRKILKSDNTEMWISTICRPLYDVEGEVIGYRGSDTDITHQHNLLESLEQARKVAEKSARAKELFLTNMSHEIRTPLNVIIGMIREIGKESLSNSQRTYLKHTEASAYHLLSIINNVLDMSKIEAGEFSLDIKDFSLSALLSNVRSILSSRASGKKINFSVTSADNISRALKGDSLRLSQVLINLLGNSIKFTDDGFVKLEVKLVSQSAEIQRIRFEIVDSGIGMSDDFLKNIFKKFTQENDSANRSYEGTGLGMSISKEIIEMMGGQIQVKSQKGKGTEIAFEIDFPLGLEEQLIRIDKSIRNFDISDIRVLIVEDNEMNRFIARQSLKQAKCIISEAENGSKAIDMLVTEQFDIILMDVQMPVMDGVEATKIIRNSLKISTPIVALTANAFKHDIQLYLSIGMNDFLIKPYKEEELYSKIETFCRKRKTVATNQETKSDLAKHTGSDNQKLFDLKQINVIANGDEKFIATMLSMFKNIVSDTIQKMNEALAANDIEAIKKLAHKIKPSLDNLEIDVLYSEIRTLENFSTVGGCPESLSNTVNYVTGILSKVIEQLKELKYITC